MIFQVHGETRKPAAQLSKSLHRFYTGKIVSFFPIRYIKRKTKIYFSVELRKDNGSAPAVHKAGKLRTVPREEGAMVRKLVKLPIRSITVAPKNHIDLAREGMKEYLHSHGYEVDVELSRIKLRY